MDIATSKVYMDMAIDKIKNISLREFVRKVVKALPDKAWEREASLKYHHEDEHGCGGNMLHERRVAVIGDKLAELCNLSSLDKDLVRAACLLHDATRHGENAMSKYTINTHSKLVRPFIEKTIGESDWTDPVCKLLENHMSNWDVPPYKPEIGMIEMVIIADFLASQPNIKVQE